MGRELSSLPIRLGSVKAVVWLCKSWRRLWLAWIVQLWAALDHCTLQVRRGQSQTSATKPYSVSLSCPAPATNTSSTSITTTAQIDTFCVEMKHSSTLWLRISPVWNTVFMLFQNGHNYKMTVLTSCFQILCVWRATMDPRATFCHWLALLICR